MTKLVITIYSELEINSKDYEKIAEIVTALLSRLKQLEKESPPPPFPLSVTIPAVFFSRWAAFL